MVVLGIGFALPTLTTELPAGLPSEQAGVAGGLQSATRELGSALGIAVVGKITVAVFARNLPTALQRLEPDSHTVAEAIRISPADAHHITDAFVTSGSSALQAGALFTLVAGAFVVALATRNPRVRK